MKNFVARVKAALQTVTANAVAYVRLMLATEPVRLRAWLMSLVSAGAVLFPALSTSGTAGMVVGVVMVVLPILLGEGARSKVTPTA